MTSDSAENPSHHLATLVERLAGVRTEEGLARPLNEILEIARRFVGAATATLVRKDDDGWRTVAARHAGKDMVGPQDDADALPATLSDAGPEAPPASRVPPTGITLDVLRNGKPFGLVAFAFPGGRRSTSAPGRTVEALTDAERAGLKLVAAQLGDALTIDDQARELHEARKHLGHLVHVDPLTELANHRGARKRYGEFVTRSRFSGRPLSVIVFEIDGVSSIRERWGRPSADRVVRSAAGRARAALRPGDAIARTGPNRFFAILPDAPLSAARAAAERIVTRIEELRIEAPNGHEISLTAHGGVARILKPDTTYEDVLVEVDRLMADARRTGEVAVQTGLSVGKEY